MSNYSNKLSFYKNKKILITGGLGFIGSNLAVALQKINARLTIIDSMNPEHGGNYFNIEEIKDKVKIHIFDMCDEKRIEEIVCDQDIIFNLAGQVSHIDSMTNPLNDLATNATCHLFLLEALRKKNPHARVIHTSTRQIYGRPKYLPVDEKHIIAPTDINGINKYAGEQYHTLYHNVYNLPTVILRLTNTYGPKQLMKHNRQGFIPVFIHQIIDGQKIKIFGDGQQVRDINYVEDVVTALLLSGLEKNIEGKIYNLGAEAINLENLTKLMIKVANKGSYEIIPFPDEKKKIDIGDCYNDYSKIKKDLGWQPTISLSTGLAQTFAFYNKFHKYYW